MLLVTEGVTKLLASLCGVGAAKCESAFHLLVQNKAYFLCSSQLLFLAVVVCRFLGLVFAVASILHAIYSFFFVVITFLVIFFCVCFPYLTPAMM